MSTSPQVSGTPNAMQNPHQAGALSVNSQKQGDAALVYSPAGHAELATQEPVVKNQLDPESMDPLVAGIPLELDVTIPLPGFRVRNLLALAPGAVVESEWDNGSDLPLRAGHVTLAWTEFEVVDTTLAVRITRLA